MHDIPDVEVEFDFIGRRKYPSTNGYRPAHQITEKILTTGTHHYYGSDTAPLSGKIMGTIAFLAPDEYPGSLWVGKKITIQEGAQVIGYAKILKVFTPQLIGKENDDT